MPKPCNIRTNAAAYNHGLQTFKDEIRKAKTLKSPVHDAMHKAMDSIREKFPTVDFDNASFEKPVLEALKKAGLTEIEYDVHEKQTEKSRKQAYKIKQKVKDFLKNKDLVPTHLREKVAEQIFDEAVKNGRLSNASLTNAIANATDSKAIDPKKKQEIIDNITKTAKELEKKQKELKAIEKKIEKEIEAKSGVTVSEDEYKKVAKEYDEANKQYQLATSKMDVALSAQAPFFARFPRIVTLNLMGIKSMINNLSGAIPDAFVRTVSQAFVRPRQTYKAMGRLGSDWFKNSKEAWGQVKKAWAGVPVNDIAEAQYFNSQSAQVYWEKFKATKKLGDLSHFLAEVTPSIVGKTLGTTDQFVWAMTYNKTLDQLANTKNLKGIERAYFLRNPTEDSKKLAVETANKATFRNKLPSFLSVLDKLKGSEQMYFDFIKKGNSKSEATFKAGTYGLVRAISIPFIKVPVNIVRLSADMTFGEATFIYKSINAKKMFGNDEAARKLYVQQAAANAGVSLAMKAVAMGIVAAGGFSGGYKDEDDKERDVTEQIKGGYSRINMSLFWKKLTGEKITQEDIDGGTWVETRSLGALGITLASMAKVSQEVQEEHEKINATAILEASGHGVFNTLTTAYDQSFLTGASRLMDVFSGRDNVEKWATKTADMVILGVFNSSIKAAAKSIDEDMPVSYDKGKPLSQNVVNAFMAYTGKTDNIVKKYHSLIPLEQTEDKSNAKVEKKHLFFDNYLGRLLHSQIGIVEKMDNVSELKEIYNCANKSRNTTDFYPSKPTNKVNGVYLPAKIYDEYQSALTIRNSIEAAAIVKNEEWKQNIESGHPEKNGQRLKKVYERNAKSALNSIIANYPDLQLIKKLRHEVEKNYNLTKEEVEQRQKELEVLEESLWSDDE